MKKMLSITLIYLIATLLFCETSFAYIGYNDVYITYNFSDTVTFHRGDKSHCYFRIGPQQYYWNNCDGAGLFLGWGTTPLQSGPNSNTPLFTYSLVYPENGNFQDTIYMYYTNGQPSPVSGNVRSIVFIQIPPEGTSCRSNFLLETNYGDPTVIFNEQAIVAAPDSIINYEWSFGDGSFSNEPNPIHTYSDFADYNVCLTVTTAAGHQHTNCRIFRLFIYPPTYVGDFEPTIDALSPICYGNFVWNNNSIYNTDDIIHKMFLVSIANQPDTGQYVFPFNEVLQPDWETCNNYYNSQIAEFAGRPKPYVYKIRSINRYGAMVSQAYNLPSLPPLFCNIDFSLSVDSLDPYTVHMHNLSESNIESYIPFNYRIFDSENGAIILTSTTWDNYTLHFGCGGEKYISLDIINTYPLPNICNYIDKTIFLPLASNVNCNIGQISYITNMDNNPKRILLYTPNTYIENYNCYYSENTTTWDFGDGNIYLDEQNSYYKYHTYADYGVYNVCCTIDIPSLSCSPSNCQTIAIFPVATNQPENGVPLCKILPSGAVYNSATLHIEQPDQLPALLTLFDLSGKVAWQQTILQTPTQLELSQLPSGVYITHLQHKNYTWQTKLVKM